jgi:predicted PhzF superfamily epimerase YddE/YHI9
MIGRGMPSLHVLRVFTDDEGRAGNPLGVFLDGTAVPADRRQETARRLGFSETVFVDDASRGGGHLLAAVWAWQDEARGVVRSRVFPLDVGIVEDEATGAAAVRMCAMLGRPITIHQGRGSVLHARPLDDGLVEVGGRCALDEVRQES